jgi:hypothetical protein
MAYVFVKDASEKGILSLASEQNRPKLFVTDEINSAPIIDGISQKQDLANLK